MGYELVIRNRTPDQVLSEANLSARLSAAVAAGIPDLPPPPTPGAAPAAPSTTVPSASEIAAAAIAAAASAPASPLGPWTLKNLGGRLEARLSRIDGVFRGVDFEVPFPGTEDELRRSYAFIQQLAEREGAIVYDPQLAREVGGGAVQDVVGRWKQSQTWMMDVAGTVEDTRSLGEIVEAPPILGSRSKIVLLVGAGFLVLYWLIGAVAEFFRR